MQVHAVYSMGCVRTSAPWMSEHRWCVTALLAALYCLMVVAALFDWSTVLMTSLNALLGFASHTYTLVMVLLNVQMNLMKTKSIAVSSVVLGVTLSNVYDQYTVYSLKAFVHVFH